MTRIVPPPCTSRCRTHCRPRSKASSCRIRSASSATRCTSGAGVPAGTPAGTLYHCDDGAEPGRALALIAAEALEAMAGEHGVEITAAESRRNVLTRGIDLSALVGKRFRVGSVECVGVELCEPCMHLESVTRPGVIKGL